MYKKLYLVILSLAFSVLSLDAASLTTKARAVAPAVKNACKVAQEAASRNFSSIRTNVTKLPERIRNSPQYPAMINALKNTQRSFQTNLAAQQQCLYTKPVIREVRAVDKWVEARFNRLMGMSKQEMKQWVTEKLNGNKPEELRKFFAELLDNTPEAQQWIAKVLKNTKDVSAEKMTDLAFIVLHIYKKFGIKSWHDYKMSTLVNVLGKGALVKLGVLSFLSDTFVHVDVEEAKLRATTGLHSLYKSPLDREYEEFQGRIASVKDALELEERERFQREAVQKIRTDWVESLTEDQLLDETLFRQSLQDRYVQEAEAISEINRALYRLRQEEVD